MDQIATALLKELKMLLDLLESKDILSVFYCQMLQNAGAVLKSLYPKLLLCGMCSTFIAQLCYKSLILRRSY